MSWAEETDSYFSDDCATFGDRLAAARIAAGMDQKALARRVGVKLSTVERWENDVSEPRANRISMLTGILNVSLPWLLMGQGEGISPQDGVPPTDDIKSTLDELRDLRMVLAAATDRIARLEKRLRQQGKEKM